MFETNSERTISLNSRIGRELMGNQVKHQASPPPSKDEKERVWKYDWATGKTPDTQIAS